MISDSTFPGMQMAASIALHHHDKAFKIITEGGGRSRPDHLDPKILEVFSRVAPKLAHIFEPHGD